MRSEEIEVLKKRVPDEAIEELWHAFNTCGQGRMAFEAALETAAYFGAIAASPPQSPLKDSEGEGWNR